MASITNYTGDAGLGLGSNAGIAAISPESRNLNVIQDTANRMMLMNHQNNLALFQQKIADRDTLYKTLNDGQIVVGDIEPKDRPYYEKAKKEQENAFYEMAQNGGVANKEAYRKYIQATTALKETVTHVQARKIGFDQYKADIAKEPIEVKRKQIEEQYKKQLDKDSGSLVDPYQTSLDLDLDALKSEIQKGAISGSGIPSTVTSQSVRTTSVPGKPDKVTTFQKTVPIKAGKGASQSITTVQGQQPQSGAIVPQQSQIIYKNGLPYNVTSQYVDFNKLKNNAQDVFLEKTGAGAEQLSKFYDMFTDPSTISHEEIKPTYDYMVRKAQEYNRARGFVPLEDGSMSPEDLANGAADVKKLINAFNVPPDPKTGKRNINMSKPELGAYFALADMDNFATRTETPNKELADIEAKNRETQSRVTVAKIQAGARVTSARITADGKKAVAQIKAATGNKKKDDETGINNVFFDAVSMAKKNSDGTYSLDAKKLPSGYLSFMGGIGMDAKGKLTANGIYPFEDGKLTIKNGFFMNDKLLSDNDVEEARSAFNDKNGVNLSTFDFAKEMMKQGLKVAPAYLVGMNAVKDGQVVTVNLNQILDGQKALIGQRDNKGEQVPTEITIENEYNYEQ